ncbi:MAG: hypothetical protein AMS27_18105 [Bacteroides sp. SM23_62_1]|nr:MAG: hypothetical protein AMS27_18105 [Bacteroides sp. SM23_62_1]
MSKPDYIQDLETRMTKLEICQKERRQVEDNMMVEQADMKRMINQIHICLMGTDYEKNGGLVSEFKTVKADVKKLKIWKTRIVTIGSTVSAILGGLITFFATRINGLKELLK